MRANIRVESESVQCPSVLACQSHKSNDGGEAAYVQAGLTGAVHVCEVGDAASGDGYLPAHSGDGSLLAHWRWLSSGSLDSGDGSLQAHWTRAMAFSWLTRAHSESEMVQGDQGHSDEWDEAKDMHERRDHSMADSKWHGVDRDNG